MTAYIKFDTRVSFAPETCPLSDKAFRVWTSSVFWCGQYGTLWIPKQALRMWRSTIRTAREIELSGLWLGDTVNGQPGWWLDENELWAYVANDRSPIPPALRQSVLDRDGHACLHCGATEGLQMDHVYPWSRGGKTTFDNLQTLCGPCNRAKGAKV